jgi:hypothetical protein
LWVAVAIVIVGSLSSSSEYWTAAPWVLVVAIPFCAVTLGIAAVTFVVHRATGKVRYAGACLALLVAGSLASAGIFWRRHSAAEAALEADQQAGQALVESTVPTGFSVSLSRTKMDAEGVPVRFVYYAYSLERPADGVMAIVDVSQAGTPRLRLACVVPEAAYQQLPSGEEPCRAAPQ